jgi:tRNA G37 N-methylase TrmD
MSDLQTREKRPDLLENIETENKKKKEKDNKVSGG